MGKRRRIWGKMDLKEMHCPHFIINWTPIEKGIDAFLYWPLQTHFIFIAN